MVPIIKIFKKLRYKKLVIIRDNIALQHFKDSNLALPVKTLIKVNDMINEIIIISINKVI